MSNVVAPGSPGYEALRKPAIARFHDARPVAIALCAGSEDVAEAIAFARRDGLALAVRSGGHCFAGRSSTDGVVIDVSPMRSVAVGDGVATIGAGARLGDVYDALDAHGLTIPAGCGPAVGISGLTLGGGLGILGRLHGLTSDSLRGAQVVLADGRVVSCDEREEADLFWALRGAGGARFGVVTSLVFATVPAPPATAFEVTWDPADAATLIGAWQDWSPAAPDALAASLLVDERVRVIGAMVGAETETARRLDELAAAAGVTPASTALAPGSYREAKRFLSGLGETGEEETGHLFSRSEFFAERLPATAIDALVRNLHDARAAGFARELDFSPWGGAYARTPPEATAFAHRDARFLLKHAVMADAGAPAAAAREWLDRSWALTHPYGTGGVYPNFPEDGLDDWAAEYHGPNRGRLLRLKRRYDPHEVFGATPRSVVGVDHVQVAAPPGSEREARGFYGRLLGLRELEKPEALGGRGGAWFAVGAQELHVGVTEDFTPAHQAHPGLRVGSDMELDRLAEGLVAAGADVEWDDRIAGRRRFFTADPWGNRVELLGP
jgi:FAD/FMN-containing dehydrogenase/catechol 2,3-dioxygenase-like lactoylglutathione lyase family enzyme